jgi:flagellar basal body rod protein FlgC
MDILGIAQQGLQQAQGQFDQTAQQIAQVAGPSKTPEDSVTLSDEIVSLMTSQNQYETNLGVAHVASRMEQATISLLA